MKKLSSISFAVAFLVQVAWAVDPADLAEDLAVLVAEEKGVLMPDLDAPHVENRGVMELADGLVNLHEYWTGCDPWTVDGTNTLLSVIATSIDSRIAGVTNVSVAWPLYNNYIANGNAGIFERNTNCWAQGIDSSFFSIWNTSDFGNWRVVTAISPRHVLIANHAAFNFNWNFVFQAPDGAVYTNRITSTRSIAESDIKIGLLETALPSVIVPAKILPSDYHSYIHSGKYLPVLTTNQGGKALVYDFSQMGAYETGYGWMSKYIIPSDEIRHQYYEEAALGDSGRPLFFMVEDDLVLIGSFWWGYGTPSSSSMVLFSEEVQSAMDELCPGYSLNTFNLSQYQPLLNEE